jgi:ADP-L-glycero-D-manno-heptose 6-epimerase
MQITPESRVLVTGGAGFIGSALIWELNRRGVQQILVADKLVQDEKWRNLVPLKFADYIDGSALEQIALRHPNSMKPFDFIFHLGACSATTEKDEDYLMRNNFEFTKVLARWALTNNSRFVYASSAATYGDGKHGMDDQLEDLHQLRPLNMYGYSKHWFDIYAKQQGWLPKMVGFKYFNVFGPNEGHKGDMRSVVHKAYHQILKEGKVQLFKSYKAEYKDGEQLRDFLYVKDAINMSIHLAETEVANGLYNLGSGQAKSWLQLTRAIFTAMNLPENIEFIEMPETLKGKYQYYTCADITKLRNSGYTQAGYSLEAAVKDYVQHYLMRQAQLGDEPSV